MGENKDDGWGREESLVMHELQRLADSHDKLIDQISGYELRNLQEHAIIQAEIAALKVKSGMWGAVAGALMAAMIIFAGYVGSQTRSGSNAQKQNQPKAPAVLLR